MGEEGEGGDEKWVHDSSVDYKGRVSSSSFNWLCGKLPPSLSGSVDGDESLKVVLFGMNGNHENEPITTKIPHHFCNLSIELSERLSYFGLATDLFNYFSKVLNQDSKTAAKNVNYWIGVTTVMPLLGGFLADAITGFKPLDNVSVHPKAKTMQAIGNTVGILGSFGADQFDDNHPVERKKKMSYFNWWNFALCCGLLAGVTVIVYVDEYVGWGASYLILTSCMAFTILTFYAGKRFYRYRLPEGSPLTPMLQVLVAAIAKRNLPYPSNPDLLYEVPKSHKSKGRLLCHTNKLRFLDKAAIIEDKESLQSVEKKQSPWRLATVTKVEEMKLVLNMIPIWFTTLTFGLCVAQATTFFIKQSDTMNLEIIKDVSIPSASIYSISAVGMIISVTIYEKILVPLLRRATGTERGIKILQRIGFGMIFSVLSMSTAALVERKRLRVAEEELTGGKTGPVSMSVLWLAPQYLILGFGDGFTLVGLQEYFYGQVPDSMRSLGIAFYLSVIGVGNFYSSLLITVVDHATEKSNGTSWFRKDLNKSRLDNFYWLLAAMSGLNLCVFVFLAKRYSYKSVEGRVVVADCEENGVS
ncbi:Protein NRT1/ PTR family 5.6 [Vitis vinifera]|uniref:Protein NRT1/ PTR family 5.6 n=1 Tax=Vitis vinifera TaxID=29760 RepID=A0A438JXC8_VITVI|nr:Protein NRT1/ PTR family 5.6 [Vitis vinifera]